VYALDDETGDRKMNSRTATSENHYFCSRTKKVRIIEAIKG
jgi:hypothetical protein